MTKILDFSSFLSGSDSGGCSAKLPAKELSKLMEGLPLLSSPHMLVGPETHDDAAVWKVSDEVAMIHTTDFFPPFCSDPYEFGEIAAANSLSDVYAMGGTPLMALNLVMFPKELDFSLLEQMLSGGSAKMMEASCVLAGGHTIHDPIPKYGLSVVGQVHPEHIISNAKAKVGDVLILTKPLGSGILLAGLKTGSAGLSAKSPEIRKCFSWMKTLNDKGALVMKKWGVQAGTDITGFGLLGHAYRMALASEVSLSLNTKKLPILDGVESLLELGLVPGSAFNNLQFIKSCSRGLLVDEESVLFEKKMLVCDAQTSGGLLFCVSPQNASNVIKELMDFGLSQSSIIGEVVAKDKDYSLFLL